MLSLPLSDQIHTLVRITADGCRAKDVARTLGVERTSMNGLLYRLPTHTCVQHPITHRWTVPPGASAPSGTHEASPPATSSDAMSTS